MWRLATAAPLLHVFSAQLTVVVATTNRPVQCHIVAEQHQRRYCLLLVARHKVAAI